MAQAAVGHSRRSSSGPSTSGFPRFPRQDSMPRHPPLHAALLQVTRTRQPRPQWLTARVFSQREHPPTSSVPPPHRRRFSSFHLPVPLRRPPAWLAVCAPTFLSQGSCTGARPPTAGRKGGGDRRQNPMPCTPRCTWHPRERGPGGWCVGGWWRPFATLPPTSGGVSSCTPAGVGRFRSGSVGATANGASAPATSLCSTETLDAGAVARGAGGR